MLVIGVCNSPDGTFVHASLSLTSQVIIHASQNKDYFVAAVHSLVSQAYKVARLTRLHVTNHQSCPIPVACHVGICQLIQDLVSCAVNFLYSWSRKSEAFLVIIPKSEVACTAGSEFGQPIRPFIIILHDRRYQLIDFAVCRYDINNHLLCHFVIGIFLIDCH